LLRLKLIVEDAEGQELLLNGLTDQWVLLLLPRSKVCLLRRKSLLLLLLLVWIVLGRNGQRHGVDVWLRLVRSVWIERRWLRQRLWQWLTRHVLG
jgi:hypothetical protein